MSAGAPSSWCRIPQLPFPPDARSSPRLCARALCTRPPLPRLFNPKRRRAWPSAFDRATTCTSTVLKIRATAATAIPRGRCGLGRSRSAPRRAIPRGRGGTSIWIWIRATRDARRSRQCKLRAPPPPRPPRPPLFGGAPLPRPRPRHLSCRCLSGKGGGGCGSAMAAVPYALSVPELVVVIETRRCGRRCCCYWLWCCSGPRVAAEFVSIPFFFQCIGILRIEPWSVMVKFRRCL